MDKYTGKRLDGRYEIHELLGVGGMAVVYRAYDTIDDRMVAIKILKDEFAGNSEFLRRFRNESKAIAVLSHPNIVKVYDVSFGDRMQYIVMEYVDGITLREYLDQQKEVRWKEAIHFTVQILRALQHAHEKGIVHRDIKPQNIMLLQDGTIKVMDFGIARFARSETRTMTDKAIGSVHYIAPEQARGDLTDEKADIYSVGVMLYEMITGQLPFEADNAVSVAIMQLQANPTLPREINPDIPEGLQEITMKAMQKVPSQRYQSAAEMLSDIEQFRRNPGVRFEYKYFIDDTPTKYVDAINTVKGTTGPVSYNDNYEYEEDLGKKQGSGKTRMVVAGIGTAFLIMALILGVMVIFNQCSAAQEEPQETVTVPKFVGLMYPDDIVGNEEYEGKFKFRIENTGNDPDQENGVILKQTPNEGIEVYVGKEVVLTVNNLGESVTIPPVSGLPQEQAESVITDRELVPKIVTVADDETAKGYVTGTNPPEGTSVTPGTEITIYVSSGPSEGIAVPQVIDKSLEAAKAEIMAAGLTVGELIPQDDSDKPENVVLETDPLPGVKVASGSRVNIIYSSGKQSTKTVDVIINLPVNVDEDIQMRIYLDNSLIKEDVVNPGRTNNELYPIKVEGTSGKKTLLVTLNGQDYVSFELDFDSGTPTQLWSKPFTPTATPTPAPESTPEPDSDAANEGTQDER